MYWRRRLVLLVVVLGCGFLVFALITSVMDRTVAPAAAPAIDSASTGSRGPAPSAAASSAASGAPEASGIPVPVAAEPMECADDAIAVSADTDASTYRVGEGAVLTLRITNVSTAPCLRDIGPRANELIIRSGGYHVWSSDDCSAGSKSKMATLQPGERFVSTITWDGVTSRKGCPDAGKVARAGRYDLTGRNGRVMSDPTPFSIRRKTR